MEHWRHLVLAAVLLVLAVFFKVALLGYTMLACVFFGAALVVLAYYALKKLQGRYPGVCKQINRILSYGLILFLLLFAFTEAAIIHDAKSELPEDTELDCVIVLGAGVNGTVPSRILAWRLETALQYLQENPETMCIVSGGQGPGEDISEAQCMAIWLQARGIDGARILLEDQSTSTMENLLNSKAILEAETAETEVKVGIITNEFHMMRAKLMAGKVGLDAYAITAPTRLPVLMVNYFVREVFALWKFWIFG